MKRFRYRLARLERLRKREQREAAAELAEATAAAESCRSRRRSLESAERELRELWHGESQIPDPAAGLLRGIAEQLESLRRSHDLVCEREARAMEELKARRQEYMERSRACRVLETLREKRWRRWLADVVREEQQQLDELHLLRPKTGLDRQITEAKT